MNTNLKNAALVAVFVAGTLAFTLREYNKDIYARFPHLDHKVCRKAYRLMLRKALTGQLENEDTSTDAACDIVFAKCVDEINAK